MFQVTVEAGVNVLAGPLHFTITREHASKFTLTRETTEDDMNTSCYRQ